MSLKQRLSATVDEDLLNAGHLAVSEGQAENISAWVNEALRMKVESDRRLRALDEFITAYELEHGEITDDEIREIARRVRAGAVVVRASSSKREVPKKRSGVQ